MMDVLQIFEERCVGTPDREILFEVDVIERTDLDESEVRAEFERISSVLESFRYTETDFGFCLERARGDADV